MHRHIRVPEWLQTSESVWGSQLSGEVGSVLAWLLRSASIRGSQLSRDAWVTLTPAGDALIKRCVLPQMAEDPSWSAGSIVLSMSVVIVSCVKCQDTNICGMLCQSHQLYGGTVGCWLL
jgi:hypothetical protein